MKKLIVLVLILFSSTLMASKEFGLKFDNTTGILIKPDEQFLARGLRYDKDGYGDTAMKNFIKSAKYGNYVAMSMIGFNYLKNKQYIDSLAWLRLIDIDKIPNKDSVVEMVTKLEAYLRPDEMLLVDEKNAELKKTYGALPTLLHRENWKNNIKVTGSRNKGKIPLSASFNLVGGIVIGAGNARSQVDDYVYEYKYSDQDGRVLLKDFAEVDE